MTRIGLTGSTGFIGKSLVETKLTQNPEFELFHLGRTNKSYENFIQFDLGNLNHDKSLPPLDYLVHLAAYVPSTQSHQEQHGFFSCERVNGRGTLELIDSLPKQNLERVIFVSSAHIWANKNKRLLQNFYEGSKLSGELINEVVGKRYDYNFLNLRLSYVYGPGSKHGEMFDIFMEQAHNDEVIELHNQGKDRINLIHVKDAIEAINNALTKNHIPSGTYPVCEKSPTSTETIAKTIKKLTGSSSNLKYTGSQVEATSQYFDYQKTKSALNFEPETSLNEGIKSLINEESN